MNKEFDGWRKSEWISFGISMLVLLSYLCLIIWWAYISNEISLLKELINNDSRFLVYLLFIGLGGMVCSRIVLKISMIFYPTSKEDIELRKIKKKLIKEYPFKIANLKYEELKKEKELEKIQLKIKKESK